MHHFAYRGGVLHAEAVSLDTLATAVGTPFYCYSTATLARHYKVFAGAFADVNALVCYAMKANSNQAVVATLAKLGAGADVVSEGELMRARLAGVPADKIMFSGIGKTARELALAVDENILCINVDVSHFHAVMQTLTALVAVPQSPEKPASLFKEDWHERINEYIQSWIRERGLTIAEMSRAQKQQLVTDLAGDGAFGGRNAAAYISRVLGLGRATVYNYLKKDQS